MDRNNVLPFSLSLFLPRRRPLHKSTGGASLMETPPPPLNRVEEGEYIGAFDPRTETVEKKTGEGGGKKNEDFPLLPSRNKSRKYRQKRGRNLNGSDFSDNSVLLRR